MITLIQQLLTTAENQVAASHARVTRLEGKANALVAAAGLSVTVATATNALLAGKVSMNLPWVLVAGLLIAETFGLAAVISGITALLIEPYKSINSQAIFRADILEMADEPPGAEDILDAKERQAFGLALYRQYLIPHLWEVYQGNTAHFDLKARRIELGQRCFIVFLILLVLSEAGLGFVLTRQL